LAHLEIEISRSNEYHIVMPARLRTEIHQEKPFKSPEQEAFLNLQRTADVLMGRMAKVLAGQGVSPTQYNVLRILHGAGDEGLPCGAVAERMITRDPDITRLMDRLEKQGLLTRTRDTRDRRVVVARITDKARRIVSALEEPVEQELKAQLGHLGQTRLRELITLLEAVRET
jgi:DNA-binding MarR family transcriptional regulator